MKKHLEINHSDDRGTIRDIFVSSPKDHCSIITFTPNAVRANHFHKESTQYTYVVDGEILMATCLVDQNGEPAGEVEQVVIGTGDLVTHPPYHAHAFRALKASTILAFADGVRGGSDYERDVFRLKASLV
jgi:dTDP-4-dehydrorhamnose 3,5-epimerase-like enzyme